MTFLSDLREMTIVVLIMMAIVTGWLFGIHKIAPDLLENTCEVQIKVIEVEKDVPGPVVTVPVLMPVPVPAIERQWCALSYAAQEVRCVDKNGDIVVTR